MATLIRGDGRQVTAYQDAAGFNFAFKGKTGVIVGIGNNCNLETINGDTAVKVRSGMAVIQGRQIMFDGSDEISLPTYQGTTIYSTVYAELNMAIVKDSKQGEVTIKRIDSTTSKPSIPPSDDLFKIPTGKAYINLGGVEINGGMNCIYGGDVALFPDATIEPKEQSNFEDCYLDENKNIIYKKNGDDRSPRYVVIFYEGAFISLWKVGSGNTAVFGTFYRTNDVVGGGHNSFEYAYKIESESGYKISLSIAKMPTEKPWSLSQLTYEKVTSFLTALMIY